MSESDEYPTATRSVCPTKGTVMECSTTRTPPCRAEAVIEVETGIWGDRECWVAFCANCAGPFLLVDRPTRPVAEQAVTP